MPLAASNLRSLSYARSGCALGHRGSRYGRSVLIIASKLHHTAPGKSLGTGPYRTPARSQGTVFDALFVASFF